jgi:hypothetical protein
MKRKKIAKKKSHLIDLHMYGIFDVKRNTIIKISLDPTEIQMEIALSGGLNENLTECEFNVKLAI